MLSAPSERIWPLPGELYYAQLGLGGVSLGEAALVVGPDGSILAIDVANDSHDDDLREALHALESAMEQAGFAARPPNTLDHVLITHLHADHADGLEDLAKKIQITGSVVHRGLLDITEAANQKTAAQLCRSLSTLSSVALCRGVEPASCDPDTWTGTYPSTGCELDAGDLTQSGALAGPSYLPLGGASVQLLAVNGQLPGASYVEQVGPFLVDDLNGENARSVVGLVVHGEFRLLFSGDLTAGTDDSDPVEEFYALHLDLQGVGVDVLHLSHHGRDSSSSTPWLELTLPADGASKNALMGVSTAHLLSPHREVLDRVLSDQRLGDGRIWTTEVAAGGATDPALVSASGGQILVRTQDGGSRYVVQAVDKSGQVIASRAYYSARYCP